MAEVNPNDVAKKGITDIQGAIDRLTAQQQQPGADIPGIDAQINALQQNQQDLRNQALRTIEDSDANKQAIAAMNAAAAGLTTEASKIKDLATALTGVAKVATAAASLITSLAPFLV
jgi:septal ring factor EnvC (AmiA/AmiB activator)